MTDDIQALKDKVVEAAKAVTDGSIREVGSVYDAVAALRAAEEAARKPRLRNPEVVAGGISYIGCGMEMVDGVHRQMIDRIKARDAEWIVAIKALRTHQAMAAHYHEYAPGMASGGVGYEPAILLADILALAKAE